MTAARLRPEDFDHYPPQGRELATQYFDVLRQMPLAILPTFLFDLKDFDWKFPVEQSLIEARFQAIVLHPELLRRFDNIRVSAALDALPWAKDPQGFLEAFTAFLWSSHQMDDYRAAATQFVEEITPRRGSPPGPPMVIVLLGKDAQPSSYPLFERLRPHGQVWTRLQCENAARDLWAELSRRAQASPNPYQHWYIEGADPVPLDAPAGVTRIAYRALDPVRNRILERISESITTGTGPEQLRTWLGRLTPRDVAAERVTDDPRLQHFFLSLLTQNSGAQIFATSFVQLATQEVLKRAQPRTVFVRYAPRQRQMAFNAMIAAARTGNITTDPQGSLIDADMGAYYAFLHLKGIAPASPPRFIAWLEGQSTAFISGPGIPAGTTTDRQGPVAELLGAFS